MINQVILAGLLRFATMEIISISEARSRFSELVSRASAGERFMIQRRGHSLAVLLSSSELARLERIARMTLRLALALGQSDELLREIEEGKAHPLLAAYGLWADEEQTADLAEQIKRQRRRRSKRPAIKL
jgi:prevent-host-death family protein